MPVRTRKKSKLVLPCALASVLFLLNGTALAAVESTALPEGASVAAGSVAIAQQGAKMEITQSSQKAIINWQSFDVGSDASVNFIQPNANAIALNRVVSAMPSTIDGRITANGQIWLINPAGVVLGAGAVVNAAGVVASTMDITDQDFLGGNYAFSRNGSTGSIVNAGTITASDKGYIALLAPELRNDGILKATLGTVALAAGETVVMSIAQDADRTVTIKVDPAQVKTLIENRAAVLAPGGTVILSAKAADQLFGATIKNAGVIEAAGITEKGGVIELVGADEINSEGTLDASGTTGGTITIAAAQTGTTNVAGTVKAAGSTGVGGKIVATGKTVSIAENTRIDATGSTGGGEIDVGGSWEGLDSSIQEATMTKVASSAVLDASALDKGNGGTVVVRSDIANENSVTLAYGSFLALGGANGGNGGRIETSGHYLETTGASGSAAAAAGAAGTWLFDPYNVTINSSADTGGSFSSGTWTPTATSTLLASSIESLLNGGTSVVVTTGSAGSDLGDIIVNSAITKSSGGNASLTLRAADNVTLNEAISSSNGALNLNFYADSDHNGTGIVLLYKDLTTNGGSVSFGDGTRITLNGVANTLVGGDLYVGGGSAQSITTNGGAVNVQGQMLVANPNGLSIDTNGGNVTFSSLVDSGNSYSLVSSAMISWATALSSAASCTVSGANPTCGANAGDTYLATVTSRLENAVVTMTTYIGGNFQAAWLGGKRVVGVGTNALWRWVTGPEGLEDSGQGLGFFTQNGSDLVNGSSGTVVSGMYANWNSGEPNNSGGTSLANAGETVIQTLGSSGRWNDLSGAGTASVNYYVKETNLADSPLSINAGSGAVTFSGAVGTNKALSSLSVTAGTTAINGGAVTTDSAQTYNSAVTLGSANTTLTVKAGNFMTNASQSITNATGSSASLNVIASNNVSLGDGTDIGSPTGALSVSLLSQGGTISLSDNSTIDNNGGTTTLEADGISFGAGASLQGSGSGTLVVKPHTSARTLGIGTGAAGAQNISDSFLSDLIAASSFSKVTFGSATTGTITVAGAHNLSNSTLFESVGDVVFASDAALNLGSNFLGLTLDGAGSVTQDNASVLTAGSVVLRGGSGTFTLNNGTNTFGTIAANASTLNFVNQGALTVGTVDGVQGVTTASAVSMRAVGATADVTLNKPVATTNGTILIRAGRTFINNNSTDTGLVAGGGNDYYVYASTPVGGTRAMTNASKHYNQAYTGITPGYAAAGNWFFYEIAPTLTVRPALTSIVYGSADPTIGVAYDGFIDGDTDATSGITGSAAAVSIAAPNVSHAGYRSAGDYTTTLSNIGTLASSLGYAISLASNPTSTLTVTPKALTLGSITVANKVYDGTTAATISSGNTLSGILAGDESYLTVSGGTAAFDTKNVGTGKTVSATGVTLSGVEASNYQVTTAGLSTTANITPATLTYIASPVSIYTGATSPSLSGSVGGFAGSDTLANATAGTLAWATDLVDTTHAASYYVNGSGLTATNYIFAQAAANATALTVLDRPKEPTIVQPTVIEQNAPLVPAIPVGGTTGPSVTITETSINNGAVVDSITLAEPAAVLPQTTAPLTGSSPQAAEPQVGGNQVVLTVAPPVQNAAGGSSAPSIVATVTGDGASGFRFALSAPVVEKVTGTTEGFASQAQLMNGQALPSWLSYNPVSHMFSSSNVPPGSLPLTIRVRFIDPTGKTAPKILDVTISE